MIDFNRYVKFKIFIDSSADRCGLEHRRLDPYPNMITNLLIHLIFSVFMITSSTIEVAVMVHMFVDRPSGIATSISSRSDASSSCIIFSIAANHMLHSLMFSPYWSAVPESS